MQVLTKQGKIVVEGANVKVCSCFKLISQHHMYDLYARSVETLKALYTFPELWPSLGGNMGANFLQQGQLLQQV